MNRELIYSKFFDLVKGVADFKTASRRLKHWSDVAPAQQPALFVSQRTEINNKQTLGGLVAHAWIDGVIETDEGVLGDQAVAIIPVVIKTA